MSASTAIKIRLNDLGMTQTELAKALGTTRQNLANKLARDNFSAKELCAIGEVLKCSVMLKDENNNEYVLNY